jgi:hypothetical protein
MRGTSDAALYRGLTLEIKLSVWVVVLFGGKVNDNDKQ